MHPYEPQEIANATGGTVVNGSAGPVTGVAIDSRKVSAGDLFVAITTQTNDGHRFVADAFASGAKAALVNRKQATAHLRDWDIFTLIVVDDSVQALQTWAREHRRRFNIPVVAVTGSNGKTTTKDLTAAALCGLGPVLRTQGTLNNHLGVPLTLLEMDETHRAAVIEMGMNHPGEIRLLGRIAEPTLGIITNTGQAHLEFFNSMDELIDAKWELTETMRPPALMVLNRDDAGLLDRGARYGGPVRWFAVDTECEWRPEAAEQTGDGCWWFSTHGTEVTLRIPGRHMVNNALAALATAEHLGVPVATAAADIGHTEAADRRMRSICIGGVLILDDAYNANPSSMNAALDTLASLPPEHDGRRFAVLGGMWELGDAAAELHREVGRHAARGGVVAVVVVGEVAAPVAEGARECGAETVRDFETHEEAAEWLAGELGPGDTMLVKGSRGEHMERVIDILRERLRRG